MVKHSEHSNQLNTYCKKNNIRLTPLRIEVFNLICMSKQPITAYELLRQLRQTRDNAEPPTVYRVLEFLQDANLIHRIATSNAYIACMNPDVPHQSQIFLCNACGHAIEIDDSKIIQAMQSCAETYGFYLTNDLTEIRGTCINCH